MEAPGGKGIPLYWYDRLEKHMGWKSIARCFAEASWLWEILQKNLNCRKPMNLENQFNINKRMVLFA